MLFVARPQWSHWLLHSSPDSSRDRSASIVARRKTSTLSGSLQASCCADPAQSACKASRAQGESRSSPARERAQRKRGDEGMTPASKVVRSNKARTTWACLVGGTQRRQAGTGAARPQAARAVEATHSHAPKGRRSGPQMASRAPASEDNARPAASAHAAMLPICAGARPDIPACAPAKPQGQCFWGKSVDRRLDQLREHC